MEKLVSIIIVVLIFTVSIFLIFLIRKIKSFFKKDFTPLNKTKKVDALRYFNKVIPAYYNEQLNNGIEFVITLNELKEIMMLPIKSLTMAQYKKEIKNKNIELPKDLPETLFRTITLGISQYEKWHECLENKKSQSYLLYDAIPDSRTRDGHAATDGIIRKIDDDFWKTHYPPNGINCRCLCISLNERKAKERSKNNQGTNKLITSEMKPDNEWNFNIGENLDAFVKVGIIGLVRKDAIYSNC